MHTVHSPSRVGAMRILALAGLDAFDVEIGEWIYPASALFLALVFAAVDRWSK